MDFVDKLIKDAQKQLEKTKIQTKGFLGVWTSNGASIQIENDSKTSVVAAKQTLSKNSKELKQSIKGAFGKKIITVLSDQEKLLDNI